MTTNAPSLNKSNTSTSHENNATPTQNNTITPPPPPSASNPNPNNITGSVPRLRIMPHRLQAHLQINKQ
jgi:hypothetical protein